MNYLNLGYIKKPFGNKGELIFNLQITDYRLQINKNDWIFVDIDGELVPFQIESIYLKDDVSFIAKLRDITIEKADKFIGLGFYIPDENQQNNLSEVKSIIGYDVIDKTQGNIGKINEVIFKTGQDLLQVTFKDKQILIPVNEDIILKINHKNKLVNIAAPEGLIDLYLNV
jgi:16S rRNA processing protein RimM